eukprot:768597-Hanusia_phi.AAC.3
MGRLIRAGKHAVPRNVLFGLYMFSMLMAESRVHGLIPQTFLFSPQSRFDHLDNSMSSMRRDDLQLDDDGIDFNDSEPAASEDMLGNGVSSFYTSLEKEQEEATKVFNSVSSIFYRLIFSYLASWLRLARYVGEYFCRGSRSKAQLNPVSEEAEDLTNEYYYPYETFYAKRAEEIGSEELSSPRREYYRRHPVVLKRSSELSARAHGYDLDTTFAGDLTLHSRKEEFKSPAMRLKGITSIENIKSSLVKHCVRTRKDREQMYEELHQAQLKIDQLESEIGRLKYEGCNIQTLVSLPS